MALKRCVSIVGSGNWGSTIGKIVGYNIVNLKDYEHEVKMWVFEENINGRKLTEIINQDHMNVKYLPDVKLPQNLVAVPDLIETIKNADILVFVLPHQFLGKVCEQIKGHLKPNVYGVSLIKGLGVSKSNQLDLISDIIRDKLNIPCTALMGANLADEVSKEFYCEATIGSNDTDRGQELKKLFQTNYFRMVVIKDEVGCELCGALKNIVALGAGFSEGLGYGDNTKAAIIRLGFMEMIKFANTFFKDRGIDQSTFLESCGVADLITTCYGGRNKRIGKALVETGKTVAQLELELLNGQSAQGPLTAKEVNQVLVAHNMEDTFPLFTAIFNICEGKMAPAKFIDCLSQVAFLFAVACSVAQCQYAYRPKTENGEFCMIPFEYQGKIFHDCTTEGDSKAWCRPASDKWGYCSNTSDFSKCQVAAPTSSISDVKLILDLLNNIRMKEPALRMSKIRWNTELAQRAQYMSNQCRLGSDNTNLCTSASPMGQISYATMSSEKQSLKWTQFILEFYNQKSGYNYDTNTCTSKYCNGYKQLVNARTTEIGCAVSNCKKGETFADYYFCNFYPPIYQHRPYEKGETKCDSCYKLDDNYLYRCTKDLCEICDSQSSDCQGKEVLKLAIEAGLCEDLEPGFCELNASVCPNIDLLPDEYKVMMTSKCKKTCKLC